tara:strand:+ start:1571 stop:1885 length:315 start_codon:yes stop_codon:yes gene_type:complete
MKKIIKNDEVIVLTGKDKGKRGIVKKSVDSSYLIVEGINIVKKTVKPNPSTNETGGITDKTMPIHISNVGIYNSKTGKADKVGIKFIDGKKVRVFKSSSETIKA